MSGGRCKKFGGEEVPQQEGMRWETCSDRGCRVVKCWWQVVQGGGGCSVPGNVQGQVGQGSEQPDLAEDPPAYCSRFGLHYLKCLFQPTPFHEDLMMTIRRAGAASGSCSCRCSKGHHPRTSHLPCGGSRCPCVGVPQSDC